MQPFVQFVFAVFGRLAAFLVFPVCRKSLLGHLVHAPAAYLHLNPAPRLAHERGVERLVAVGLGMAQPVAETFGMGLVDVAGNGIDVKAIRDFVFFRLGVEDDAYGQDVIDFLKGHVLVLHLAPDAVGRLDAGLYLILDMLLVESLADGGRKFVEGRIQVLPHAGEPLGDGRIFLGMFIAEAQVLQLLLHLVEPQSVGKGRIDVERFAGYLVLLAGELAPQGAHVVQAVRNLDEDDTDVVAHGEKQFLERLCLCRCLVAEDASRNLGEAVHNLCHLLAEDVADVLGGIVGVLHHVVEQGGTDAGAAQPYLFACNLRHGDGVHDVGLAAEAAYALMGLLGKIEGLADGLHIAVVARVEVCLFQVLVGLLHEFLFFLLSGCLLFHSIHFSPISLSAAGRL